jgi:hypothetical protein
MNPTNVFQVEKGRLVHQSTPEMEYVREFYSFFLNGRHDASIRRSSSPPLPLIFSQHGPREEGCFMNGMDSAFKRRRSSGG